MKPHVPALFLSLSLLSGCATIVGEPMQTVPISSTPDGASVTITDETGKKVFKGTTPTTVTLEKSSGRYWGGKSFNVVIAREGYDAVEIPVKTSVTGWYIAGNAIFGGAIGWFAVDPFNGDMYKLSVKDIDATLTASTAQLPTRGDEHLSIVLLENVPTELVSKLVKIN